MSSPLLCLKSYCRACSGDRNSDIVGKHEKTVEHDDGGSVWTSIDYFILRCRGCDNISFLERSVFSEEIYPIDEDPKTGDIIYDFNYVYRYWPPKVARKMPSWLTTISGAKDIKLLFLELYIALNGDAAVLASIATRTIFDAISEKLSIDNSLPFTQKLDALLKGGKISNSERDTLEILVDAGSAAAHRGWRPKPDELNKLVNILEHFAQRVLSIESDTLSLKSTIPVKADHKSKTKT